MTRLAMVLCTTLTALGLPTVAATMHEVATAPAAAAATTPGCTPSPTHTVALDGTAMCGTLSLPADEDTWAFSIAGSGNEAVFDFGDTQTGCACLDWRIYDAQQHVVPIYRQGLSEDELAATALELNHTRLLPAGAYSLVVKSHATLTGRLAGGTYSFRAWAVPSAQTFTLAFPTAVGTGKTVPTDVTDIAPGTTPGDIDVPGSVDVYNVHVPDNTHGARVAFKVNSGSNSSLRVVLRDSARHIIEEGILNSVLTFANGGIDKFIPPFLAPGDYTIAVGPLPTAAAEVNAVGAYSFSMQWIPDPQQFSRSPAYSVSAGSPLSITSDGKINGVTPPGGGAANIESLGSQDVYTFDVPTATNATIHVGSGSINYALVEPAVVGDPTSHPKVLYNRPLPSADAVLNLPAAQGYQLAVGTNVGAYAISITAGGTSPLTVDRFFITPAGPGGSLTLDSSVGSGAGNIESSLARDVYTFTASAGQRLSLQPVSTTNGSVTLDVRTESGWLVASQCACNGNWFVLPYAGRYSITASGAGAYAMKLLSAPVADAFTIQMPTDVSRPVTVSLNQQTNPAPPPAPATLSLMGAGNLDKAGAQDLYQFVATKGQRFSFSEVSASATLNLDWRMFDVNGIETTESANGGSHTSIFYKTVVVTIAADGVYTLPVSGNQASVGTYSFKVALLPPAVPIPLTLDATKPVVTVASDGTVTTTASDNTTHVDTVDGAGSVDQPGSTDEYTFHVTAGDVVYFSNSATSKLSEKLYSLAGQQLKSLSASQYSFIPIARSGTYHIIVAGDLAMSVPDHRTGQFGFTIAISSTQRFSTSLPFEVADGKINGADKTHAGNVEVAGERDAYEFQGTVGQMITISNVQTGLGNGSPGLPVLLEPDGFATSLTGACGCSATLPQTGLYTLLVDHYGLTGAYSFNVDLAGTTPLTDPARETFSLAPGDFITPDKPQVGEGLIEPGAEDVYQIDALSGDAGDFMLLHSDPNERTHNNACTIHDNQNLFWTLRDPDGTVIFASDRTILHNYCVPIESGAIVFAKTGTYTLTINGATIFDTYDLSLTEASRLREAAQPGQEPPPPSLSSVSPARGYVGYHTTVSVYGVNVDRPTAVHVTSDTTGASLPVTLRDARRVRSSLPAIAATAQIDMTGGAVTPGLYTVRADLPDGSTLALSSKFEVLAQSPLALPRADVAASGWDHLRFGTMSIAYVDISNPTDSDWAALPLRAILPTGLGPTVMQVPQDTNGVTSILRARGVSDESIDDFRSVVPPARLTTATATDASGRPVFAAVLPPLPAHGSTVVRFEFSNIPNAALASSMKARLAVSPIVQVASPTRFVAADETTPPPPYHCHNSESKQGGSLEFPRPEDLEKHLLEPVENFVKQVLDETVTAAGHEVLPQNEWTDLGLDYLGLGVGSYAWAWGEQFVDGVSELGNGSFGDGVGQLFDNAVGNLLNIEDSLSQAAGDALNAANLADDLGYADRAAQLYEDAEALATAAGEAAEAESALAVAGEAAAAAVGSLSLAGAAALGLSVVGAALIAYGIYIYVSTSCDPNALVGPGTPPNITPEGAPVDGGPIRADSQAPYLVEFENDGTAPARLITVTVPLSPQLDPSTFTLGTVRLGSVEVPMKVDPHDRFKSHGSIPVTVNGNTTTAAVDSVFTPNDCDPNATCADSGLLTVTLAGGPDWSDPFNPGPHADILPPNTTSPEGEGSFVFSAQPKHLPPGSPIPQAPAHVEFDGSPLDTNAWTNETQVPGTPVGGSKLKQSESPTRATSKTLDFTVLSPALKAIDPRQQGLAILVRSEAGDEVYAIPKTGWKMTLALGVPKRFKYASHTTTLLVSATLDVSRGKVRIRVKGSGSGLSLATMPTAEDVVLVDRAHRFCAHFGGITSGLPHRSFVAAYAPAEAACRI